MNSKAAAGTASAATTKTLGAANAAAVAGESGYVTTAMTYINDVDAFAPATTIAADAVAFTNATTAFVTSVVNQSAASVADFNASKVLNQMTLQNKVLTDLVGLSC